MIPQGHLNVIQNSLMIHIREVTKARDEAESLIVRETLSDELRPLREALRSVDNELMSQDKEFQRLLAEEEEIERSTRAAHDSNKIQVAD